MPPVTAELQGAAGHDIERRIAQRLARLRAERGWSLDAVAERTDISRATLSRLERSELSPTSAMLGRLCTLYGWTLSRLMAGSEIKPPEPLRRAPEPGGEESARRYRPPPGSSPAPR